MKKFFAIILLFTTFTTLVTVPAGAETTNSKMYGAAYSTVSPRLNNGASCGIAFGIDTDGTALVCMDYTGMPSTFTKVTVTSYIQKRFLGIFWTTVDIGQPDNKWVDSSTDLNGNFKHEYKLSDTGTYRAVVEFVFSGTGGADDVIEEKMEDKYE